MLKSFFQKERGSTLQFIILLQVLFPFKAKCICHSVQILCFCLKEADQVERKRPVYCSRKKHNAFIHVSFLTLKTASGIIIFNTFSLRCIILPCLHLMCAIQAVAVWLLCASACCFMLKTHKNGDCQAFVKPTQISIQLECDSPLLLLLPLWLWFENLKNNKWKRKSIFESQFQRLKMVTLATTWQNM